MKTRPADGAGKVVCFLPCCGIKRPSGKIITPERYLKKKHLPNTWDYLEAGRRGMRYCFQDDSPKTSAWYLYAGSPYEAFAHRKDEIAELLKSDSLRLFIVSAGYGLLDALEPALDYDEALKGKAATHWRKHGLSGIIADLLLQEQPAYVYGFFAGDTSWSTPSSKYRYFFTQGVRKALEDGLQAEAGCFYRKEGLGVKAILGGLGRTFIELLESGLDESYVKRVLEHGRQDGNVKIGFDRFSL